MTTSATGRPESAGSDPSRWDAVRGLFERALETTPERVEEFVRDAAGADAALADDVLELLARHLEDDGFLTPTSRSAPAGADDRAGPWAGRRFGSFRILSEIAAGGMGVVYEAEQETPQRRVALKVLRSSLLGSEVLRRFREESEILGRLRHPGIAQVHAAGTAQLDGQGEQLPFIALELVEDAATLVEFAASRGLDWRDRVGLLLQICDAVQHGHQRGVIHRDLKPQNVLVDGEGRCKVVDFGIARLVRRDVDDAHTVPGMVLGTPAYMSPEQLEGDRDAVDVRTDVYALGVMMFELLTGSRPFDVAGKPLTEVLRILRETDTPPRPSMRAPALPREVDWIFGRAIERVPSDRYASVSELAADLRRLLGGEPVLAGPPSTIYRLRKLAARHRVALSATVLVLASLVTGLVVSLTSRAEAIRQRDRARQEQRVTESVLRFVEDTLAAADPDRMGRDVRVRDLLRDAGRELDATPSMDPLVRAALDFTLGRTFAGLGIDDVALERLRRAMDAFTEHAGPSDRRTIQAESAVAAALRVLGERDEAFAVAIRAVAHAESLPRADEVRIGCAMELAQIEETMGSYAPAIERLHGALDELIASGQEISAAGAMVHTTLGEIQRTTGEYGDARAHIDRAVEIAREVHGPGHPRTSVVRHARALVLEDLGERAEAERVLRDVVARSEEALGPEHRSTLSSMGNLGALLRRLDRRTEAGEILERLLGTYRSKYGPDDPRTLATQNNLGLLRADEGRLPDAEELLRDALEKGRHVFEAGDVRLTSALQNLAMVLRRRGDADGAAELLEEALALLETHAGPDNPRTLRARFNLGVLARYRRDFARAEELVASALEGRRATLGPDHPDTLNAMHELARIQRYAGRLAESAATARELLERRRERAAANEDDDWIIAAMFLAQLLDERGSVEEAGELHDEVVAAAAAAEPERALRAVNARNVAADFWIRQGETAKARALLQRNVEIFESDPAFGASRREMLLDRTRGLLEELDRIR